MIDPSNALGTSALSPSEISQIDEIIELLQQKTLGPRLHQSFEELDQILGSLYGIYLDELQFLAHDDPQNQAANQIAADFSSVRPLVAALRNDLSVSDWDIAAETSYSLRAAIRQLFVSFGDLRSQAREGPFYSEIPFTQELIRVAHHYLKGKLPLSAVQERLDAFCHYHERLENRFEESQPSTAEAAVFKVLQIDFDEALSIQLQGIEDLEVALERRSEDGVKEALEVLTVAAQHLVEIYKELREAHLEPTTKTCFRCGASNEAEARVCGACQAILPRFDADTTEGAQSTIVVSEQTDSQTDGVPEEYLRLERLIDEALGTQNCATLADELEVLEGRVRSTQRQLKSLRTPPSDIPTEHGALLEEGKHRFTESLVTLSKGVALLREGAPKLDAAMLRRGLEEVGAGFDIMREFQDIFQRAQSLTEK